MEYTTVVAAKRSKSKKPKPTSKEKKIATAIAGFKYLCENSEKIFKALLIKYGKENDFNEKIDEDSILENARLTMKQFIKNSKVK